MYKRQFFITFHIYIGALGHTPTAHYKAMFVTGYEESDEKSDEEHAATGAAVQPEKMIP